MLDVFKMTTVATEVCLIKLAPISNNFNQK